jgi:hypothetical protein
VTLRQQLIVRSLAHQVHSELIMTRIITLVIASLFCGLQADLLQAQLRGYLGPAAQAESARTGLLGRLREAREERLRREAQVAGVAAMPRSPNTAANALSPAQLAEANRADNGARSANAGTENTWPLNAQANAANTNTPVYGRGQVSPASATRAVPNRARYDGLGVTIRLPENAGSAVNYLIDEVENKSIRPGEVQVLDSKGRFVVRYSRGVTADGRSFGESRYTITPGRYRFELTATGWELYREADSSLPDAPSNRLDFTGSLPSPSQPTRTPGGQVDSAAVAEPQNAGVAESLPQQTEPAVQEAILPPPRRRPL